MACSKRSDESKSSASNNDEEEVFFGQMTQKEKAIASRLRNRRTEFYYPDFRTNRPSLLFFRTNLNEKSQFNEDRSVTLDESEILFDSLLETSADASILDTCTAVMAVRRSVDTCERDSLEPQAIFESISEYHTATDCSQVTLPYSVDDAQRSMISSAACPLEESHQMSEYVDAVDIHNNDLAMLASPSSPEASNNMFMMQPPSEVPQETPDTEAIPRPSSISALEVPDVNRDIGTGETVTDKQETPAGPDADDRQVLDAIRSIFRDQELYIDVGAPDCSDPLNCFSMKEAIGLVNEIQTGTNPESNIHAEEEGKILNEKDSPKANANLPTAAATVAYDSKDQSCQTSFTQVGLNNNKQATFKPPQVAASRPVFKTPVKKSRFVTPPTSAELARRSPAKNARIPSKTSHAALVPAKNSTLPRINQGRFKHIISPIAKYINEAPPPPLISNNKPMPIKSGASNGSGSQIKSKIPQFSGGKKLAKKGSPQPTGPNVGRNVLAPTRIVDRQLFQPPDVLPSTRPCHGKENMTVLEDTIIRSLGIPSAEELDTLDEKLRNEVMDFVKAETQRLMLEAESDPSFLNETESSDVSQSPLPRIKYKCSQALVTMQPESNTKEKLTKMKNKTFKFLSPAQPTVLKHTGQRKIVHLAGQSDADGKIVFSPRPPLKHGAPVQLNGNPGVPSTNEVDASIVEVVSTDRAAYRSMK